MSDNINGQSGDPEIKVKEVEDRNPSSRNFGKVSLPWTICGGTMDVKIQNTSTLRSSACLSFDASPICAEEFEIEKNPTSRFFGQLRTYTAKDVLVYETKITIS